MDALRPRFLRFAERSTASPLYRQLALQIADDPAILEIAAEARSNPATNLLFAAVQSLLLAGAQHPLRDFYPRLSRQPSDTSQAFPAFRDFCLRHKSAIIHTLHYRRTQTNEVSRCSYLLLGLTVVAAKAPRFSIIDVGSSAGLHLLWRQFAYHYRDQRLGDPDSPVQLRSEFRGLCQPRFPTELPEPVEQVGIDLQPLNPLDRADQDWLRALIWPEQSERADLLEAALQLAAGNPPVVLAGDVFDLLPQLVERTHAGAAVCICHSHVINQFSEIDRSRLDQLLLQLSADRDIYRLAAEWIGTAHTEFTLSLYRRRSKGQRLLALVDDHGSWIHWSEEVL